MTWPRKIQIFKLLATGVASLLFPLLTSCGVKGDPLPPEQPAELGRGRPTYKSAADELMQPKAKAPKFDKEDKDDDDEE